MNEGISAQSGKPNSQALSREELLEKLNSLLSREYNSLIQYIYESNPYVPAERRSAFNFLEQVIADERRHAERLANLIVHLEGIPQPGPYNIDVADINYLSLNFLAQLMIEEKQNLLNEYQELLSRLDAFPEIRRCVEIILTEEKNHLQELKKQFAPVQPTQP